MQNSGDTDFLDYDSLSQINSGNMYGTSKSSVEDVLNSGKICILDIDVQGVKAVKTTDLTPLFVFIKPPSLETLEQRLRDRGTETEESLRLSNKLQYAQTIQKNQLHFSKRLGAAAAEMEYGEEDGNFDIVIVNDNLETAYIELRDFVMPQLEKLHEAKNPSS